MFKMFRQAFMIRGTESTNQFIYSLKRLPVLRKLLHNTAYAQGWIKIIAYIFFFSMEVIKTFKSKFETK